MMKCLRLFRRRFLRYRLFTSHQAYATYHSWLYGCTSDQQCRLRWIIRSSSHSCSGTALPCISFISFSLCTHRLPVWCEWGYTHPPLHPHTPPLSLLHSLIPLSSFQCYPDTPIDTSLPSPSPGVHAILSPLLTTNPSLPPPPHVHLTIDVTIHKAVISAPPSTFLLPSIPLKKLFGGNPTKEKWRKMLKWRGGRRRRSRK